MDGRMAADLDRHITGNYGEDQLAGEDRCPACGNVVEDFDEDEGAAECTCGWVGQMSELVDESEARQRAMEDRAERDYDEMVERNL